MLCCLIIDSVVARRAANGPHPVQLRPLCLFNPAVGTRPGFTVPFLSAPFRRRDDIAVVGQAPTSWRTEITGGHCLHVCVDKGCPWHSGLLECLVRRGMNARVLQYSPDRRGVDADAQLFEFANDSAVSPANVFLSHAEHKVYGSHGRARTP